MLIGQTFEIKVEGGRLQNPLTTLRSSTCALISAPYSSKDLMIFLFPGFQVSLIKGVSLDNCFFGLLQIVLSLEVDGGYSKMTF
jgi:hypothetical protein